MPSTRTELPWDKIYEETKRAMIAYAQSQETPKPFIVNCNLLADYIDTNQDAYPFITNKTTLRGIAGRLTKGMRDHNWILWSGGKGKKFVVPWDKILE